MTVTPAILFQVIVRQCPHRVLGIRPGPVQGDFAKAGKGRI
jgi:hypothetical protein